MPAPNHPELSHCLQQVLPSAQAEAIPLPLTPAIKLYLINQDFPQQSLSQDEMLAVMNYPAYWAFCWASGQVLAQYLLEQPERVRGKTVLDFGSGSGVVAIAAAMAGAATIYACDIDPDAMMATAANAKLNQVELKLYNDFFDITADIDVIIVADVLYDKENLPWLGRFIERAPEVLVADSRVKHFSYPPYTLIERREGSTVPDLDEFDEFRDVRIYYAHRR
ncbi:class I SAM-dependent methyltransferase [Oceanicoccus sagamiensis]|uniref:Protein methyltransferase n=1 Tax=Oceanicoccus sagamiensis TaxID=716816 RepID=A0A1X9NBB3_9GAMM|nr:50S ribosomal protein L11 methyltransferase [Oceanicoccus sagamiensis]ARN73205.1 protein methyltransferase [Oceanicoccus sagamiensis]